MMETWMFGDILIRQKLMYIVGGVIELELDLEMFDGE